MPRKWGGGVYNIPDFFITLVFTHLPLLLFVFLAFCIFVSCEKEVAYGPEMDEYYVESCNLTRASSDSIHRFDIKVYDYTQANPVAKEHPKYTSILNNIRQAYLALGINVDDEWAGETYIEYVY